MKRLFVSAFVILTILSISTRLEAADSTSRFNSDWQFRKNTAKEWQPVSLPHTAHLEPYISNEMWMGECSYQKKFTFNPSWKDKKVSLEFEGAMGIAKVSLNGQLLTTHHGGYIGFQVDLTDHLKEGNNLLEVDLDNRESDSYPPGKEYKRLDFSWFSGLYRNVNLHVTDKLHISHAIAANQQAGGGIFVTYPEISAQSATIQLKTHVVNDHSTQQNFYLDHSLWQNGKRLIGTKVTPAILKASENKHITQTIQLKKPQLWSPTSPHLYTLKTRLIGSDKKTISETFQKIGVRHITYLAKGFFINGEKLYQRGTNRHQEFPYLGYAASDEAQYRDAVKIKEAGFDIVRLSHYPQSPAFMRACDELGLMVVDCITGWQFYKNGDFATRSLQEARDMIRRDRNHPCVVLWETSLNESNMPGWFLQQMHDIVDQEYPGEQSFSGAWQDGPHDVFLPARQHGKGPKFWDDWKNGNKPAFTAEYGDWEYYAQAAANFNQDGTKDLKKEETTSRQLRKHGEKRMLQMALNYQESHNQNQRGKSLIGDANWLMFDYNRGYANDHCSSGVMDLMRLPKFAYYFYRSQRPASENSNLFSSGPMVFAATYWQPDSNPKVRVFSNCETVTAYLNGKKIATQRPDKDHFSDQLNSPPFTFHFKTFTPGELKFVGSIKGKSVAEHVINPPGKPTALKLTIDESGKALRADNNDFIFVYASVIDANGTVVPTAKHHLHFKIKGGDIIGPNTVSAEAGINGILVRSKNNAKSITIDVEATSLTPDQATINTKP